MHPLAATDEEGQLVGVDVGFGEEDRVRVAGVEEASQLRQEEIRLGWIGPLEAFALEEEGCRIEPVAGYAQLQPEADDLLDLGSHPGVAGVQVRLVRVEPVP